MLYLYGEIEARYVLLSSANGSTFSTANLIIDFDLSAETHSESLALALYLHTLVSFTSPNTWAILKVKSLTTLKPGMSQLCSNILGALVQKGFFLNLRVSRYQWNCFWQHLR